MKRYAYGWITAIFFLVSIFGHWLFSWCAFVDTAQAHGQSSRISSYPLEMGRDTSENWQSEFLHLIWQVVGLAYFLYIGSPASRENDDRLKDKINELLKLAGGTDANRLIATIDRRYLRTEDNAKPHGHGDVGHE